MRQWASEPSVLSISVLFGEKPKKSSKTGLTTGSLNSLFNPPDAEWRAKLATNGIKGNKPSVLSNFVFENFEKSIDGERLKVLVRNLSPSWEAL